MVTESLAEGEAATAPRTVGVGGAEEKRGKEEEADCKEEWEEEGGGGGGGKTRARGLVVRRTLKWHIPASLSLWLFLLSTGMTMFNSLH